ncbi:MAG TPA: hypothetical protein GXX14_06800 [Clostridiaceae bacterium]|nr:hypothetical protein [Clostridiaceae bacterium]
MKLELVLVAIIGLLFSIYVIFSNRKLKKISDEIENIYVEQSKISFRLFVAEKKQSLLEEKE